MKPNKSSGIVPPLAPFIFNGKKIPSLCLINKALNNEEREWLQEAYRVNAWKDPDRAIRCAFSCPRSLSPFPFYSYFLGTLKSAVLSEKMENRPEESSERMANISRLNKLIDAFMAQNDPDKNMFEPHFHEMKRRAGS